MTAKIIDGKAIAAEMRNEVAVRVDRLESRGVVPGLAVVIVGEDPASQVYVRNKALASGGVGMHSEVHALSADTSQAQLLAFIRTLNENRAVHGILVQLPLPRHIDARAVVRAIDPAKDVDGFHYENVGALVAREPAFYPCTPWGVMKMLEHEGVKVVDVGISRLPDGKLAGDVDFEGVSQVASRITPVPGGVGPMTIAMLLANTVKSAERTAGFGSRAETRIA